MKVSNETKVGAFTAIGIAALLLTYSYLSGNDVFSGSNKFYAIYKSVEGLSVSKPVLVNGYQVGRVSKMELQPDGRTIVEFKVDKKYDIPSNTLAQLQSTDLLGGKAIIFELGNSPEPAQDEDTLRADIQGSLAESLQPIQKKVEALMTKMDSSLASINRIMNPEFERNVDRSFASIANSLQTLEGTTKKIDALVGTQSTNINTIMGNAATVSSNLKATSIHFEGIATNLQKFSNDLASTNIQQTMANADKAVANLQATTAKINSREGSLGLLLNDTSMYHNLSDASYNLNQLFIDLKAHPKRYVSFSIFGGKD
ncbi:MCE family protein [Mucilaginibacter limnophilus]|uniref:MCE family protein n=1 Tax=Mucilaginibacter limnophilus TaxID=1932778 RepID=A0A3S2UIV0_9SPHI|nr:MlaD family protein [Mucilaginibacter limnophilus]RVT97248.1 MCE family protein [Mucilaginibacter limnophilus]